MSQKLRKIIGRSISSFGNTGNLIQPNVSCIYTLKKSENLSQLTLTCSMLTIETLEKGVEYVQC